MSNKEHVSIEEHVSTDEKLLFYFAWPVSTRSTGIIICYDTCQDKHKSKV